MTMTITAIVAVLVAYIFTQSDTLRQIMLILMIGLFFDILNTWIQNTGLLTLYVRHKAKKQAHETLAGYKEKEAEFEEVVDLEEETEEEKEKTKHAHAEHKPEHHAPEQHTTYEHPAHHEEHKPAEEHHTTQHHAAEHHEERKQAK
jgi:hypothetical protein